MTLPTTSRRTSPPTPSRPLALALLFALAQGGSALAEEQHADAHAAPAAATKKITEAPAAASAPAAARAPATPKEVGDQVREALAAGGAKKKNLTLLIDGKQKPLPVAEGGHEAAPAAAPKLTVSHQYARARALALGTARAEQKAAAPAAMAAGAHAGGEVHWDYQGENGPQAWGTLKPEFATCATGKRQSPINIESSATLQGPAEPLQLNYQPSSGTVVNNGHTIQVDVYGDNTMTVRGSTYKLLQFHFHNPSEERINYKQFAMVAHLVHRNNEGQLAVLGVLLDPGAANTLINKVWTYMPLDSGDRVRMPDGILNLNELLPSDQRYYQFMGSLTTPPCSEGVLWMVLKQPVPVGKDQLRLFGQLFPNNARPVQPLNGRAVRDAQ